MMPIAPPAPGGPPAAAPGQSGPPPVTIDAVVALLRDDRMRGFRIDVETDSLVEADQNAEKAHRVEFVTALATFMKETGPQVQAMPALAPLVGGMLQFAVRGFKVGAELEELIEKTMANVSDALNQPHPPQPDPTELVKLEGTKAKTAAEVQKATIGAQQAQVDAQATQAKAQAELQAVQLQAQHDQQQMVLDAQLKERADQRAHEIHLLQIEQQREAHAQKLQHAEQQHQHTLEQGRQAHEHSLAAAADAAKHKKTESSK